MGTKEADQPRSGSMSTCELDYDLPDALIAQQPLTRRDASRLLVVDRSTGTLVDSSISALPDHLRPGDLLILNDTRVLPARFSAYRTTGGRIDGLFIREDSPGRWYVLLEKSRRLRCGDLLTLGQDSLEETTLRLAQRHDRGEWIVVVDPARPAVEVLERFGRTPLPPYIRRLKKTEDSDALDRRRYQTVYAQHPGAVAAPTAGLHLTRSLLGQIRERGVKIAFVTLHVGVGTFRPIRAQRLEDHVMHEEWYEVPPETASGIATCRQSGGRVVAVGTTVTRALESAHKRSGTVCAHKCWTNVFIYPPEKLHVVDALLTNFHLPRSTLLALVMSAGGVETIRQAYRHAIKESYRFYSYGDAMLIV